MAARDGVPRVVAGGGDGSVDEVANGFMGLPAADRPALGVLPLGTANDFATVCRIPISTARALRPALPEHCPCIGRGA